MREPRHKILHGDCREQLRTLPEKYVQCVITSPPYFRQRDYGVEGQIGLEPTPEEFVATMVEVFREVHRVLRDDGTLWLNLGDKRQDGQLFGIPWQVALALKADGWYLRSEVIWHKPNAMPEGEANRPSTAHEQLFLFSLARKYFYDDLAIKEKIGEPTRRAKSFRNGGVYTGGRSFVNNSDKSKDTCGDGDVSFDGRRKRTVWSIPVGAEKELHFATFPPKLIIPCIKAGTSSKGCCPKCRAPLKRIVDSVRTPTRPGTNTKVTGDSLTDGNRDPQRHVTATKTIGWEPTCKCYTNDMEAVPCIVLDCFSGSGTTVAEAVRLGRDGIGCELSAEYIEISKRKIAKAKAKKGFGLQT